MALHRMLDGLKRSAQCLPAPAQTRLSPRAVTLVETVAQILKPLDGPAAALAAGGAGERYLAASVTFAVGAEGAFGFRQRPKGQFAHEVAPFFH
jgi:hypothetical protein